LPLLFEPFARFCVGMVSVATRLFSDEQLDQLRSFPGIGKDLIRYFTLTGADVAFVDPGSWPGSR